MSEMLWLLAGGFVGMYLTLALFFILALLDKCPCKKMEKRND